MLQHVDADAQALDGRDTGRKLSAAAVEERDRVLYVNPGSAGPRRFKLPIPVAELEVTGGSVKAKVVELEVR